MIDIDNSLAIPVIVLDLGPFTVSEPMLDAIAVDLQDLLDGLDPPRVVVDLSPTHHLGSKAVSVLVQAWRKMALKKGRIAFCELNAYSREVLRTLQLDRHWEIYQSRTEAASALTPRKPKPKLAT